MCKPNLKQCGAEGTIVLVCSLRLHTGENAVFFFFSYRPAQRRMHRRSVSSARAYIFMALVAVSLST